MDPVTQTHAEADLLARFAKEIVDPEVMEPMDKINWSEASPPPPRQPGSEGTTEQKPVEATVKTDNPPVTEKSAEPVIKTDIDWESLRDPKSGLILNKYTSPAESIKGVGHAVEMAKQAFRERDEAQQELARLRSQPALPTPQPTQEIRQPEKTISVEELDTVLNKIVQEGGTLDEQNISDLREALNKQSREIAKNTVEEYLKQRDAKAVKENDDWIKVENYMRQHHPESVKFTDEISLFIQSDPTFGPAVRAMLSEGNKQGATELAWRGYQQAKDSQTLATKNAEDEKKEIQLSAADQVRKEAVDNARKDAGVLATAASGVHETPATGTSQEEIEAAAREMQSTGLGTRWRALTIGKDLKGPWFD